MRMAIIRSYRRDVAVELVEVMLRQLRRPGVRVVENANEAIAFLDEGEDTLKGIVVYRSHRSLDEVEAALKRYPGNTVRVSTIEELVRQARVRVRHKDHSRYMGGSPAFGDQWLAQ